MRLPAKSVAIIDITEYYSIKPRSLWAGFKQENAAFKWLCFYLFLEYIRPQALYPVIDILPWGQIALLATCITALLDRDVKWVKTPATPLLVAFYFIVLLSAVFAYKPALSFAKFDIVINWLIVYFLIITVINTEKKLIGFLLVFFLVNFKMSQFGFRSFLASGYSSWGVSGSPGWFKDSGDLGIQMTIFVALSSAFILALREYWGRYKRLLFYMLPITGAITIIATSSRGAILGMFAAGIWFLLKSRLGIRALVAAVIVGGLIYAVIPEGIMREFEGAGEDATSVIRLALWGFGMEIMQDYPVLGIGYANWVDYCWHMNPNGVENSGKCSIQHNTMVQAVSETGISGLIMYILIIIFIFILNARTRKNARQCNNKFMIYIAHGLDGGLIAYLVASFFFSVLFYPIFWVQLAIVVALYQISNNRLHDFMTAQVNKDDFPHDTQGRIIE